MAEEVYQQSLEFELQLRSIPFVSKRKLAVFYKGCLLETQYEPDLLVFERIVVELKAVSELIAEHEAQLFNYMRIARQPVGYILNFGHRGGAPVETVRPVRFPSKKRTGTLIVAILHQ